MIERGEDHDPERLGSATQAKPRDPGSEQRGDDANSAQMNSLNAAQTVNLHAWRGPKSRAFSRAAIRATILRPLSKNTQRVEQIVRTVSAA